MAAPASEGEFDIYIDADRDGTEDYVMVTYLVNFSSNTQPAVYTNVFSPQEVPTAIYSSNVLVL